MTHSLRPLAALLLESVSAQRGPLPAGAAEVDIEAVLRAGELHRVTPAIRRRVMAADAAPQGWMEPLDKARLAQLFRHMQAASDLKVIRGAFPDSIRWAVAKGAVLSDLVWPHSDMRAYTDIDVYVHPADFADALVALEEAGFKLVDRNWPELRRQMRSELALRGPGGMMLDLHWAVVGDAVRRDEARLDLAAMLERTEPRKLGSGVVVPVFDPTDLVLHVAVHAAHSGSNKLMWLGDIHHAVGALAVDWRELDRRVAVSHSIAAVSMTLARVERVFGTRLPLREHMRRFASHTPWARLGERADRRHPFPGLPGDEALGGRMYSAARRTLAASTFDAAQEAIEVRRIERRIRQSGRQENPLDHDVPDHAARKSYLAEVAAHA